MKFKFICLSSMLIYGLYIGTAQPEAVLTSKAYVDNKVPAYASGGSPSLLTDTTTTGTIAKRAIFTDGTTYVAGTHANQIPTMGAVMSAVSSGSQSPIPAGSYGANNSLVTYDDTAGTVQERWILGEGTEEMEDNPVVGTTFYASRLRTDFSGDNFGTLADGNMTAITKTEAEESLVPAKIISKALLSKQDNIPGHAANAADSLLTDSTTTGTVQKRAIFTDGTTYVAGTHANQIPTMGAVMSAISGGTTALPWATAEQNATGAYSTTFAASGTNVWPTADADKVVKGQTFANAMATKQNKIAASEWENVNHNTIPGVVISTDENGVVEQRMILDKTSGISDQAIANTVARGYDNGDDYSITEDIHSNSVDANDVNNAVPTTTMTIAIANAAANAAANNATAALPWATAEQNATGAYSTTFANSGTNVWPTADADKVVKGQTFANAMATKQNKIPMATTPTGLYTDGSVVTHTNSDGIVGEKHIIDDQVFDELLEGQENWNTEYRNMLITAGSVYDGLSTKQNKITAHAANAADSVLTDSTMAGVVNKRAIYDGSTTYAAATDANKIPTAGFVATKQNKILTDLVNFDDEDVRAIIATNADGTALTGDTVGIVSSTNMNHSLGSVEYWDDPTLGEWVNLNNFVPDISVIQGVAGLVNEKQNKIAGYNPNNNEEKSLLTDTTTDGVVGKMMIRNSDGNAGETLNFWAQDDIIPTLGAIADAIQPLPWNTREQNATAAYSTTFANSGSNVWPKDDQYFFVKGQTFANALAVKQNKISGHAANAADSLLTDSATDGTVQKRAIFTDGTTYVAGTHANQIPTMGAVMSAISDGTTALPWAIAEQKAANAYSATFADSGTDVWPMADADKVVKGDALAKALALKQNILPANDHRTYPDGSLVEYGRIDGVPKERKIVTTVAQSGNDIPTDGAVFSAVFSAVAGKANKPTCTLTKPGDSSICYAWTFADVGASCAAYNESVSSASECCSGVTYSYISGKISSLRCGCASASDCPSGTPNCSATTHQCSEGKV